jgi:hypothetical protein
MVLTNPTVYIKPDGTTVALYDEGMQLPPFIRELVRIFFTSTQASSFLKYPDR